MIPRWTYTTSYSKGDVVLVLFPNTNGNLVKPRPAVIVQTDQVRTEFRQWIMVPISSRTQRQLHGCRVLIRQNTQAYRSMSLATDSLIMVDKPQTIEAGLIRRRLGVCLQQTVDEIDNGLRHVLGI